MKFIIEFTFIMAMLVGSNALEYYFGSNFLINWDYLAGAITVVGIYKLNKHWK